MKREDKRLLINRLITDKIEDMKREARRLKDKLDDLKNDNVEIETLHIHDYDDNYFIEDRAIRFCMTHTRYSFKNELGINFDDYNSWDEVEAEVYKASEAYSRVYIFDHSGIRFSLTPFNDPWDSGCVGFIYIPKGMAGSKEIAKRWLKNEAATWISYMNGNVQDLKIEGVDMEPETFNLELEDPAVVRKFLISKAARTIKEQLKEIKEKIKKFEQLKLKKGEL